MYAYRNEDLIMIGLIIRFTDKEKMQDFVDTQLSLVFDSPNLQTRPADSSDPKDLYVLNRGRDGR